MEKFIPLDTDTAGGVSTALMGVVAGAVAVWALDRVDWFMWNREDPLARAQTIGVRPGGEPPSHVLVSKVEQLTGLNLTDRQHDVAGNLTHYSIGITPAAGYALMREKIPGHGVSRGALFGLSLFLVQDEALNSLSGLGAKPGSYPWQAHARGLIAHVVYGVTTEFVLNILDRNRNRKNGRD
ncbi:hypothetical protein [Massilia sp. UYP11]|uniref:hypothetical protein n=1 Tax=Massilia sp. UYP11 TaxID=1756385 RepID=UPI003D203076